MAKFSFSESATFDSGLPQVEIAPTENAVCGVIARAVGPENSSLYPKLSQPTVPGWYWLNEIRSDGPRLLHIVKVSRHQGKLWGRRAMSFTAGQSVAKFRGDWFGPIPSPIESGKKEAA